jgi:hypothetical protein
MTDALRTGNAPGRNKPPIDSQVTESLTARCGLSAEEGPAASAAGLPSRARQGGEEGSRRTTNIWTAVQYPAPAAQQVIVARSIAELGMKLGAAKVG